MHSVAFNRPLGQKPTKPNQCTDSRQTGSADICFFVVILYILVAFEAGAIVRPMI